MFSYKKKIVVHFNWLQDVCVDIIFVFVLILQLLLVGNARSKEEEKLNPKGIFISVASEWCQGRWTDISVFKIKTEGFQETLDD